MSVAKELLSNGLAIIGMLYHTIIIIYHYYLKAIYSFLDYANFVINAP